MELQLDQPEDLIYCKSYVTGKIVKITAILTSVQETNQYLATNTDQGVFYQASNFVFVANLNDMGI